MKKYTTSITNKKGEQKEISVWLDDETARAIDEANDPAITQFYILDKHQEDLIDRKETRRHTSLDELIEKGHLIEDEDGDPVQYAMRMERILRMRKALSALTDKQFKAVWYVAVEGLNYVETGKLMGIRWETVRQYYKKAEEKIKKYFLKNPL
ncbi:MAG: sigma-70 family RNA polymerase sigma factor [Clostridia bacterium]|nr:sigma-70 family RNA polymerase sigma factor [Clostridia bacterium]